MNAKRVRLAIDVGGTFTDFVAVSTDGTFVQTFKLPSNTGDPAAVIERGIQRLGSDVRVQSIHHGTTLATNAILEDRLAKTALVTTTGFRDTLAIARQARDHLYRLDLPPRPKPPVPRSHCLEVQERIRSDGIVELPLSRETIARLIEAVAALEIDSVAISLINSYANPIHEQQIARILREHVSYVSASHEVNSEFREFERSSTVAANAALMPLINRYLDSLDAVCERKEVEILRLVQSNGGMMGTGSARKIPLSLVLSGPAAGVAATRHLIDGTEVRDVITLDIGGTSTDVALIADGSPTRIKHRRIGPFTLRFPSVAVESIGAGGGSIVWVDNVGALRIGPQSAGPNPGPACYGLGGEQPTVTDAQVTLGYLPEHDTGGFRGALDCELAAESLRPVASKLGMSLLDLAWGVLEVASAHMVRAIRLISIEKGHDPRSFTLVAYGGGGPIQAGRVARQLGIPMVVVPRMASVFSSYGCLISDARYETARTFRKRFDELTCALLLEQFSSMEDELAVQVQIDRINDSVVQVRRSIGLRYVGQNEETVIDLHEDVPSLDSIYATFQHTHRARFHYVTDEPLECTSLSVSVTIPSAWPGVAAPLSELNSESVNTRQVYLGGGQFTDVPVWSRDEIPVQREIGGPCLIEDEMTTIVVYPGFSARRDAFGHIWMADRDVD